MTTQILKTSFGTFKVKVEDDKVLDYKTREYKIENKMISVGGRNVCVYIKVPLDGTIGKLLNLKTKDNGCECEDKIIRGKTTVKMVKLAITIVKKIAPYIQYLVLEDNSAFPCELGNVKSVSISMAYYELMFKRATWYEYHFNAKLCNKKIQAIYEENKTNYDTKPEKFDFLNADLNTLLTPIYNSVNTWKDFFDELYKIENKCKLIYPWYKKAISSIIQISFLESEWCIDIESIPIIEYVQKQSGGRLDRKTRKNNLKYNSISTINDLIELDFDEKMNIKYTEEDLYPLKLQMYN